ncbi:restriction endonuclease subunit S [Echinicola vietnamensis]|uniref:Restriction endonuclease S subunit n=1 Tax=Echinicola vietnamensis (strain DSM 17526 / LMG 23754 / KMM 6221) TaxID=926556 RepID=L0FVI0_ECHVK|nr:restriction endonuclease subunit S [Echinicola vietnamensis]AGA76670.1 restriction endonuclease S subunit [Echinicola vietnamensis DSM 17526]
MSWTKKTLGELCNIQKGKIGIQKAVPGKYPLVVTAEERLSHNEFHFEGNAVIIPLVSSTGHGHKSLKRIHFQSGKFAVGNILCAVIPNDEDILRADFLFRYLDLNRENELVSRMKGMANVTLPLKEIAKIEIPVPPIEVQIEFVEQYGILEAKSKNLSDELTHQLDLVKQLRQAFLREAMQGKLVPQDPNEEPASVLLEKIKMEKERLIREKKLKKGKASSQSVSKANEWEIPNSWVPIKVGDIFFVTKLAGFEFTKYINFKTIGEIPVVRAQNVRPFELDKTNLLFIDKETSLLLGRCALTKESLLVTFIGAGIGDVARFREKERWHLAPNVSKLEPFEECEDFYNLKFLNYFLSSPYGRNEIFKHVKATAQPSLSMGTIRDIDVPIPPLSEQQRIVAKLDKLMGYCDQLEASIMESQVQNELLLQQVLREALEPNEREVV